jgi:hypothetical protein
MGVSTKACEEWLGRVYLSMNRCKCVEEMKAFDGAARTVRLPILMSEDKRRASGAVDHTRGKNAKDTAVPVGIVEDDAFGREGLVRVAAWSAHGFELGLDGGESLGFGGTTGLIEAV